MCNFFKKKTCINEKFRILMGLKMSNETISSCNIIHLSFIKHFRLLGSTGGLRIKVELCKFFFQTGVKKKDRILQHEEQTRLLR